MTQNLRVFTLAFVGIPFFLSACGLASMPNKMDDTNEGVDDMNGKMDQTNEDLGQMNEKMDETNEGLDETGEKLDQTNAGLDETNGKLDDTNSGLVDVNKQLGSTNAGIGALTDEVGDANDNLLTLLAEMREMRDGVDQLNDRMAVTNAGVHGQILLLSLNEMTKPENTLVLFPPVGMMPGGRQFAAEATADEAMALTLAWLSEFEWLNIDRDTLLASGYSEDEVKKMELQLQRTKEMKLAGLQVINGYLPQAKVEEMVRHIVENGRYRRPALAGLMMRAAFISMFLLDGGLFAERLSTYGQMIEAITHVAELDYLGRLQFAGEIGLDSKMTGAVTFAPKDLLVRLYGELERRFESDLNPTYKTVAADDPVLARQIEELVLLKAKVVENRTYWEARP